MKLREAIALLVDIGAKHMSSDEILNAEVDLNVPKDAPIDQIRVDIHRDEQDKIKWIHIC